MNRNIALALLLAATAGASFADDITIDRTAFTSTASRSDVQAGLAASRQSGVSPWSNRYDQLARFSSQRSRAAATAEYTAARDLVAAFTGEDSGSAYLAARNGKDEASTTVAGQPRNAQ